MAINTVGGKDVGTAIRYRIVDTGSVLFTDDELNNHLSWAVNDYSNYRPYTKFFSFNTQLNPADPTNTSFLQSYGLPSDVIDVVRTDYSIVGDLVITDIAQLDWLYMTGQLRDDAMRFARQEFQGRWQNLTEGQFRVVQNSWLWLFPIPNDSFAITVEYESLHTIDSFNNYWSIPVADAELLVDLVVARCIEIEVEEMLRQGDWSAGQTKVSRDLKTLVQRAQSLTDRVHARLSATSIVMLS